MDELVSRPAPASSFSSPSPASFSSSGNHQQELDFVSCDILEQWLGSDDCLDEALGCAAWADDGSPPSAGHEDMSGGGQQQPAAPAPKRRGRKPGPRTKGVAITHVEAERQRRDKLNRRFCALRTAVPTVSRMDKASLLADAASYIAELRGRVEQLEAEAKREREQQAASVVTAAHSSSFGGHGEKLEVRMAGRETAALRLTTTAAHHAPARFMAALGSLDLPVQHACVCRVGGVTVQDAVVDVPAALRDERGLRAALLHRLQRT